MATINKLVKFAAKFLNMGNTKAQAKKKAVSKAKPAKVKGKPAAKKVVKPVAKKAAPKAKKVVKPIKKAKPAVAKPSPKAKAKKEVKKAVVKPAKSVAPKAKPVATKSKALAPKATPAASVQKKDAKHSAPKATETKKVTPAELKRIVKDDVKTIEKKQLYKPQPKPAPVEPEKAATKKKPMEDLNLRYSDKELKEFKDLIDNKLVSAREELKNLKEALENHTDSQAGNKAWNMEEGTDTTEMEYLMNQISRQHQYIRNLELALVRIENKTYGICRVTGKLIPKERLRIVPHATLSLEAKVARKPEEESNPSAANNAAPPSDFAEGFED